MSENERLLTEKEVAELTGFSVKTLQARRCYRQEPAFIRISEHIGTDCRLRHIGYLGTNLNKKAN